MGVLLPAVFIVVLTAMMISAIYLRKYCRERVSTRRYQIDFAHDEQSFSIVLQKSRLGVFLYTVVGAYPASPLHFHPQASYVVKSNGKKRLAVPNLWSSGAGLCVVAKKGGAKMEAAVVFKDLPMANAFVKRLGGVAFADLRISQRHNKIVMEWEL